ncbi:hypothetical protein TURU_068457 [Turdus rufiventris]|nr:hypothetical protein TURU_068457 [Turdus rufiventris]
MRGMEQVCWEKAGRSGIVQSAEEKPWSDLTVTCQPLKRTMEKMNRGYWQGMECQDKGEWLSMPEGRERRDIGKELFPGVTVEMDTTQHSKVQVARANFIGGEQTGEDWEWAEPHP